MAALRSVTRDGSVDKEGEADRSRRRFIVLNMVVVVRFAEKEEAGWVFVKA